MLQSSYFQEEKYEFVDRFNHRPEEFELTKYN